MKGLKMNGILSIDELKDLVSKGTIDTVLVCLVDMQCRLMGKRFLAQHFVNGGWEETHCCNYLLATDFEMATPDGYASTSWKSGYGDYVMKPDLTTLRNVPWLEATVMVLCDVLDHDNHDPVAHSSACDVEKANSAFGRYGIRPHDGNGVRIFHLCEKVLTTFEKLAFRIWNRSVLTMKITIYYRLPKKNTLCARSATIYMLLVCRLRVAKARRKLDKRS